MKEQAVKEAIETKLAKKEGEDKQIELEKATSQLEKTAKEFAIWAETQE